MLGVALLGACSEDTDPDERCALPFDAPICGQPCTSPCGCACQQPPGPRCSGDQILECVQTSQGPCYRPTAQCAPGTCLDASNATPPHCTTNCQEIQQTYAEVLAKGHIGVVESGSAGLAPGPYNYSDYCDGDDCNTTTAGHCELGLGGCWYLGPPIRYLDQLAVGYESLGCSTHKSCDCPAQRVSATCDAKAGDWEVQEGAWLKHYRTACVVR